MSCQIFHPLLYLLSLSRAIKVLESERDVLRQLLQELNQFRCKCSKFVGKEQKDSDRFAVLE